MAQDAQYQFSASQLETELPEIVKKGVTRLFINEPAITGTKESFLRFLKNALKHAPDIFYTFFIEPQIIDQEICSLLSELYCSLQFRVASNVIEKKQLQRKASLLNHHSLVFGFDIDLIANESDTIKLFRERLDFFISLYPNHLDFPQMLQEEVYKPTAFYSAKEIKSALQLAFACTVFYSAGRAVPWFLSVLKPLRISSARFFSDFSEWLRCNNCSQETGFLPFETTHQEIEKMQILFLQMKYDEKNVSHFFPVVKDIVKLNGAFSRLVGEGQECQLELEFNPDDLCSPYAMDIAKFSETVCMEHCNVRIYTATSPDGQQYPDYKTL
ncbi:MAG: hypothetical protein J6B81_00250 [Spirochaetaceae bacterium]|nr:hypothetical protein [Spirochaetaceae bacterium]